jgi:L-amino acid N-acyltransferase YncA
MTSPENSPSRSPRERLTLEAVDNYEYRFASRSEASEIELLFERFFAESGYPSRGIKYSLGKAEAWLERVIAQGSCPHLVAIKDDAIVGVISYSLDETFCVEPVAVLHMFYVAPEHRRSAVSMVLVALCVDAARNDGAAAFHAPLASEVKGASAINLFTNMGFENIGAIMGRSL